MSNMALFTSARAASSRLGLPCLQAQQCRHFGVTQARGVSAIFAKTENPELNKILKHIQNFIILPAYLPEEQRRRVFDYKRSAKLRENPVIIEVEGLEHRFGPINRFNDVRNAESALLEAIKNMHTNEDWRNIGTLLAGYRKAGIKLKPKQFGAIVRLAGQSGNIYEVIECAKQADQTNFFLNTPEVVVSLFSFINERSVASDVDGAGNYDLAKAKQSLKWSEIVLDRLQWPRHDGIGMHNSQLVRGSMLFARAAAIKAKKQAGEDVEGDLKLLEDEVALLTTLWSGDGEAAVEHILQINGMQRPTGQLSLVWHMRPSGSVFVRVMALNIQGIAVTQEILGAKAQALGPIATQLEEVLDQYVRSSTSFRPTWINVYEKIVGRRPGWAEML